MQQSILEHEAAHAVTAWALGMRVESITVHDRGGRTIVVGPPQQLAVCAQAGDLWDREHGTSPYTFDACTDLRQSVQWVGVAGIWSARRQARALLNTRQRDVLDLAERLRLSGGRLLFERTR